MVAGVQSVSAPSLKDMLRFLEQDSRNPALLTDAATLAFETGDLTLVADLIARAEALGSLSSTILNLKGLLAMAEQRFDDADGIFTALRENDAANPALRFNHAWSKAMLRDYQGALDLLDEGALQASPQTPALKVRLLHHLGRLDDALAVGRQMLDRNPRDQGLAGALASAAIDSEQPELAARYARQAGDNADGLVAIGTLALRQQDAVASLESFDRALRISPDNPRALIGKGLSLLAGGDKEGVQAIDRGAELFRTHIGSWVAAGWGHFLASNHGAARARFQRALEIDDNFAESHGGLAVLDVIEGHNDEARRQTEIALRLDRNCFGAALAKSLLLQQRGHPQMARKVVDMALASPIGPNGETLTQMLTRFGADLPH